MRLQQQRLRKLTTCVFATLFPVAQQKSLLEQVRQPDELKQAHDRIFKERKRTRVQHQYRSAREGPRGKLLQVVLPVFAGELGHLAADQEDHRPEQRDQELDSLPRGRCARV